MSGSRFASGGCITPPGDRGDDRIPILPGCVGPDLLREAVEFERTIAYGIAAGLSEQRSRTVVDDSLRQYRDRGLVVDWRVIRHALTEANDV